MNDDMQVVVELYKKFDRYKDNTYEELYQHILRSVQLEQYKIHKDGEIVIAFTNWAFLSKEAENRYLKTTGLEPGDWNSGNRYAPTHLQYAGADPLRKIYYIKKQSALPVLSWATGNILVRMRHELTS